MSFLVQKSESEPTATKVWFENDFLCVALSDGREVRIPVDFYPRLRDATDKQRKNYELIGVGTGIHWPDVDEDLSVEGIIMGRPARF